MTDSMFYLNLVISEVKDKDVRELNCANLDGAFNVFQLVNAVIEDKDVE